MMAETWSCRSLRGALEAVDAAQDGDVIELAWLGANAFSKASVESRASGRGLAVTVEVTPPEVAHVNG